MKIIRAFALAVVTMVAALSLRADTPKTFVKYIESSGTQWVYLDGYKPTSQAHIVVEAAILDRTANATVFCARNYGTKYDGSFTLFHLSSGWRYDYSTQGSATVKLNDGEKHTIDCNANVFSLDGTTIYTRGAASFTVGNYMTLFASYTENPATAPAKVGNLAKMQLYSFKAYEKNDDGSEELKVDLYPCITEDGAVALWDNVGGKYYLNKGTGAFTASTETTVTISAKAASGQQWGAPDPSYGATNGVASGATFTAALSPSSGVDAKTGIAWACTGYEVGRYNEETKLYDVDPAYDGKGTSFVYTHPTPARLSQITWKFSEAQALYIPASTPGVTANGRDFTLSASISKLSEVSGYTLKARVLVGATSDVSKMTQYGEAIAVESPSLDTPVSLFAKVPVETFGGKGYAQVVFDTYDEKGTLLGSQATAVVNASVVDTASYTWKQDATGNWSGDWSDPAHWQADDPDNASGAPTTSKTTAKFPRGHEIVVTIDDNYTVATLDLSDYNPDDLTDALDVTLRGKEGEAFGTNKVLKVSKLTPTGVGGYFGLDRAAMKVSSKFSIGCEFTLDVANGSWFYQDGSDTLTSNARGSFMIRGDSVVTLFSLVQENAGTSLIIDNATLFMRGELQHAVANSTTHGGTVRFRGAHPLLRFLTQGKCIHHRANGPYTMVYTFEMPIGGYAVAPIQTVKGTVDFPVYYGANFLKFEIDPASPCFSKIGSFDTPIVSWPGSNQVLTNGKIIYGDLDDGGHFSYSTNGVAPYDWVDVATFSGTAKAIGAHVVSAAHNDRLTVASDAGVEIAGIVPAVGVTNQSDVAEGGAIAFSAPETYEADGTRYTCTGYTLTEVVKTAEGSTPTVTTGTTASLSYTTSGKEVALTWHFTADYKVTYATVNDADARVKVTAGSGYVTDTQSVTLEATTTSAAKEFQYWYGDVPYAQRYANPLTVSGAKPLGVTAFFGTKKENAATIEATSDKDVSTAKSWFDTTTWTGGVIPGTNDSAIVSWTKAKDAYNHANRLCVDAASFFAVKDLKIVNAAVRVNATLKPAACSVNGYGRADAADKTRIEPVGCDIYGNLTVDCYQDDSSKYYGWQRSINGGALCVGGTCQNAPSKVVVVGDLTVANGAVWIMAGYRFDNVVIDPSKAIDGPNGFLPFTDDRAFFRGENELRVLGKTTLQTPTRTDCNETTAFNAIMTMNDFRTGAAVWLDLRDVEVQEKTGITAYAGGYGKFNSKGAADSRMYSMCPGGHCYNDNTSGGSYGGAGGSDDKSYPEQRPTTHMATYGYVNAPYHPGSPNGGNGGTDRVGGGSIRLDCQRLTLDGVLNAKGIDATSGSNKGGSSGGGIWVVCSEFVAGAACSVTAAGGLSMGDNSGGGGGRVSICEGLTAEQVEELFASETHEATDVTVSSLADKLGTRFSVAGGTGTTTRSNGYDGTGVYIVNSAGKKTLVVAGDPENLGAPTPEYGTQVVEQGAVLTLEGPADAYVTDDKRSRRSCVGYTITDANGVVLVDSDETTGSYTVTTDCTITWKLTKLVHKLDVDATVGGSVTTNAIGTADEPWQEDGATISLTAVPQAGYAFAGWYGDLPTNLQANATLTFTSTKGRSVKALFVTTADGAALWTGAGDGASWEDAANWSGGAIPGANSDVTIPAGANVTAGFCVPIAVRRLTVEKGATLVVGPNGSYSTYATPRIAENANETDWQRIQLTVARDLVVNGTFAIGGKFSLAKFDLAVGGALVFGEGAKGDFYAAFNADPAFLDEPTLRYDTNQTEMARAAASCVGGHVTVGGLFSVATNAVVAPWSDFYSGASVRFDVGTLLVSRGGTIDAEGKGWGYTSYSDLIYSLSPTLRDAQTGGYGGGTHAGVGGYSETHSPSFKKYGWAFAPLLPGGPGFNTSKAPGGGVVRVHARAGLHCYGTITARGGRDSNDYAGAGGSVFLTGVRMRTCETTVVTAEGRTVDGNGNRGAGGGGRLLIGLGLSATDLAQLCESGTCDQLKSGAIETTDIGTSSPFKGTITVKGGTNNHTSSTHPGRNYNGEDGTAYLLQGDAAAGLMMIVR